MTNPINQHEVLGAILRRDFKSFVRKVFNEVAGGSVYQDNWHIDLICSQILDMRDGEFNRCVINVPPRSLKSIICSVALPAWLLGHNPEREIICVSYADGLAEKLAADCRNVMQSQWYSDAFPGTRLESKSTGDFRTTKGGGRFATSTNGTLTGRGADWIIIDDPLKPQDAMSDVVRNKCNDWYRSTLLSRLNDKAAGKIVLIMQRLHEEDLSGYVLEDDASYRHVKIPMVAEIDEDIRINPMAAPVPKLITRKIGDLLHAERDNQEIVDKLRSDMGEYDFAGQYQQNPAPLGGGLVKKEKLAWYAMSQNVHFTKIILSWDTAEKTGVDNAYSACVTIGVTFDKKFYLINCFRAKLEFPELVKAAVDLFHRARREYRVPVEMVIEDKSSGTQLIQELKNRFAIATTPIQAGKSKEVRFVGITPQIENGTCFFPSFNPVWWSDFEKELLIFPKSKFKDQCDAYAQGIEHAKNSAARPQAQALGVSGGGCVGAALPYMKNPKNVNSSDLHRHLGRYRHLICG
jgi:predicted phage terminase large subunit-like protein